MAGSQGLFTLKEAAYLRSLPAVKEVSATRITYSDRFKVECVRRYLKGESARKIFRDAGLDPSLIGAKRIERCIARWKTTKSIVDEAARIDANASGEDGVVRDLIIYQQVQQITALQEKVAELQRRIEHLTDVAAARNVATETAAATD